MFFFCLYVFLLDYAWSVNLSVLYPPFVNLFVCLFTFCLTAYQFNYTSAYKSVYLSAYLTSCFPACLQDYLSIYRVCLSLCWSFCLPKCLWCLPVCPSVCLSVYPSTYISHRVLTCLSEIFTRNTLTLKPVSGLTATPVRRESRSSRPNNILQEDGHPNDIPVTSMVMEYSLQGSSHCCLESQF